MKYLIFNLPKRSQNESSSNAWNRIANQFYKYPNSTGTTQYTAPIHHPSKSLIAFPLLENTVPEDNQIEFRGKLSFSLNIVNQLSDDWLNQFAIRNSQFAIRN